MSHVTLEQAKRLKELGYPQHEMCKRVLEIGMGEDAATYAPSAEELMEWLREYGSNGHIMEVSWAGQWRVIVSNIVTMSEVLIDALYQAACWVLKRKNLAP